MKELVFRSEKGVPVTTSRMVAEKFGKRHADVIRAIENIISQMSDNQRERTFALTQSLVAMPNGSYREDPIYTMSRDGFSLLVMGFTGSKALQFKLDFIEAFNKMEEAIKSSFALPQTYAEALRQLAEKVEESEKQKQLIAEQAPKALFADAVATSKQSCLIGELAKILRQNGVEIGQNRLFSWLRENGFLCQGGERYNQPTQRAMEMGLFEVKKTTINKPDGSILVSSTTKVTGKGQIYFVNRFLKELELA